MKDNMYRLIKHNVGAYSYRCTTDSNAITQTACMRFFQRKFINKHMM